jgi:hypothetical protein
MPDFRDYFTKGSELMSNGLTAEAIPLFDRCLLERPDFFLVWNSRGAALQKLGDAFDAMLCYSKAIELNPNAGEYYNNRGAAYMDLEQFDKAIDDFKLAANRNNKIPEIHNNRGNALMNMRRPAEALKAYQEAVRIRPDYADAHVGIAMAQLMLGNYLDGWSEFEWRWQTGPMKSRGLTYPVWAGEPAKSPDDILLFYGEQGMGDVLQFCRYVKTIKQYWTGKVWLECVHPLTRLLKSMPEVDGIIALGEKLPAKVEYCLAMMSAPRVLKTTVATVPNEVPYLTADSHRAGIWRERLKALPHDTLLVGICWAGMNREQDRLASSIDARRSMTLDLFKPLGGVKGVSWVSLQLGPSKEQLKNNPAGMTCYDGTNDIYDFYDTASLISCLDLVITVDTSVAHVAGALAKPTWLLSRYDACWRWLMDRDDSPWYPTMKLYTQRTRRDWAEVVDRMHGDLLKLANEHRLRRAA